MPVPHRALVVDDSPAERHRLAVLLGRAGWQVLEVARADAAVLAADRFAPELVVTAARLRTGSGVALLRELRRRGSTARLVVLTGPADARVHAALAALGGTCLGTPVDARQLTELLRGRVTGPAAQGTPLRVDAERVPTRPAAPSSGAAPDGYARAGRPAAREGWAARLPIHLARMADSATGRRATTPGDRLTGPRLAQLLTLGPATIS